ncbi:MAG: hypothetical protein HQM08_01165 [Candidatus Riflebacteria bacterium]|nr:hypothetical protein [Candidatus Riflebacteria bacterium]
MEKRIRRLLNPIGVLILGLLFSFPMTGYCGVGQFLNDVVSFLEAIDPVQSNLNLIIENGRARSASETGTETTGTKVPTPLDRTIYTASTPARTDAEREAFYSVSPDDGRTLWGRIDGFLSQWDPLDQYFTSGKTPTTTNTSSPEATTTDTGTITGRVTGFISQLDPIEQYFTPEKNPTTSPSSSTPSSSESTGTETSIETDAASIISPTSDITGN